MESCFTGRLSLKMSEPWEMKGEKYMKSYLQVGNRRHKSTSLILGILITLLVSICLACGSCGPGPVSGNGSNNGNANGVNNQSNDNTNSCNGTTNCNKVVIQNAYFSSADWKITIISIEYDLSVGNNSAPNGDAYLSIIATFTNISSGDLVLNGTLFNVQDSKGQQYTESQATDPGNSFTVQPNTTTQQIITSFLVPLSNCPFTVSFTGSTNTSAQWTASCPPG